VVSVRVEELNAALAGRYRIEREIGAGGMALVYLALDLKHDRQVALKVLRPEIASSVGHERFLREIQISAQLNHPHILTLIDSGVVADILFLVLPFVDGPTLRDRLHSEVRIGAEEGVRILSEIASALDYSHELGVIHRDIKPENILLHRGAAVVSDFGIALGLSAARDERLTTAGTSLGTPGYMSPEQVEGDRAPDHRSDVYAIGCLAYEMLSGEPPFKGSSTQALLAQILTADPPDIRERVPDLPIEIDGAIRKALAKTPEDRFPSAGSFADSVSHALAEQTAAAQVRSGRWWAVGFAAASLVALTTGWALVRSGDTAALGQRVAGIETAIDERDWVTAFHDLREIEGELDDTLHARLTSTVYRDGTLTSDPSGATASWRPFDDPDHAWEPLGTTPVEQPLPRGAVAVKLELTGYETRVVRAGGATWVLQPADGDLTDVVHVPGGEVTLGNYSAGLWLAEARSIGDFLLDRFEVTNAEYMAFVEAGGYERRDLWLHPFEKDGRTLTWEEAAAEMVDRTGLPGPSTWEAGTYATDTGEHPVTGVSWYEANAYATWAGRKLPTIYHWFRAAVTTASVGITPHSNLEGTALASVGTFPGLTPFGVSDMAGNAREWVVNAKADLRYTLGGGWNDPVWAFGDTQPQPPFDRSPTNGFRLMADLGDDASFVAASADVDPPARDYSTETPVSDEVFEAFRDFYRYDDTPLNPEHERTDTTPAGIRERITFDAAYGGERGILYLFLPEDVSGPLQTVYYMPGSGPVEGAGSIDSHSTRAGSIAFLVRSGRAVAFTVPKSAWEREDDYVYRWQDPTNDHRDHVITWQQDAARALDYLESRPDIDPNGFSFVGLSWGGKLGSILMALEPRFRAGVLLIGGLNPVPTQPVVDPLNFAPRIQIPVLMVNGRYDQIFPLETGSRPLYDILGTAIKEHYIAEGGHGIPYVVQVRETLRWLDMHVGEAR
jgi:predicted esterase